MSDVGKPGWRGIPIAAVIPEPGASVKFKTGDWRTFRPVKDEALCTKCLLCWIYCPDSAIEATPEGSVVVDYDYCKGCGICAIECPSKAITMVEER